MNIEFQNANVQQMDNIRLGLGHHVRMNYENVECRFYNLPKFVHLRLRKTESRYENINLYLVKKCIGPIQYSI